MEMVKLVQMAHSASAGKTDVGGDGRVRTPLNVVSAIKHVRRSDQRQ